MTEIKLMRLSKEICRLCDKHAVCALCRLYQMWKMVLLIENGMDEEKALLKVEAEENIVISGINRKHDFENRYELQEAQG